MGETQSETLERFFRTLTEAVSEARPAGDGRPVTVADIYQDLVPYRLARSAVGFAMNADYEHALMRLLAGEGEYVRLDPEEARRELQRELSSTNPDVTLYRKFASCGVVVAADAGGAGAGGGTGARGDAPGARADGPGTRAGAPEGRADAPEAPGDAPAAARHGQAEWWAGGQAARAPADGEGSSTPATAAGAPSSAAGSPAGTPPSASGHAREPADPAPSAAEVPAPRCAACHEPLPAGREVRFCPYCGQDRRRPCAECGEILEVGWRFCTACGRRSGSGS